MKIFKRILVGFVLLVAIVIAAAFVYLQTLRPTLQGELQLPGITAETEVYFDAVGIPHIYATNEEDAYYALGYLHAQDRLFQMEMLRRASSGRLSEVLGPDLLKVDKLFRTLGLNRFAKEHAEKFLARDTAGYQRAVHAYLRGVNTFVREGELPLEFTIIGIPRTEFSAEDVYCVIGFMALGFAEGFEADPVLEKLRREHGAEYLKDLAIDAPPDVQTIPVHQGSVRQISDQLISAIHDAFVNVPVPLFQGSNGWVVSAEHSKSGFPVLANDTHIGFGQPSVWYEAHIEYPGFSFYGHHLAGLPLGILGHNRFCGWGLTMFENDDVDFFQEKINPQNANQVRFGDSWEDVKIRDEVIQVKGEPDFTLTVKETRHGPIINGIVEEVNGDDPVAVSWLLLQQENHALEAAYQLARATTFDEARDAVALFSSPGLNVMYGDVAGNIAWWAAARLPVRQAHVQSKLFLDGASGRDEYIGFHDFKDNPHAINPPWGFVYSANNQPDTINGIHHAGYYFPRSRAERIIELLKRNEKLSIEDMQRINMDNLSHMHADIAHSIGRIASETSHEKDVSQLIARLNQWDGTHDEDDAAPAIYYNVLGHLLALSMRDEVGETGYRILLKTALLKNSMHQLINNEHSVWWDNVITAGEKESRGDIVRMAFERALTSLNHTMGEDPERWKWGTVHTLTHNHALGAVKPLNRVFNVGPFEVGSGSEVINNLDFPYDTTGYFPSGVGPALRKVIDFANVEAGVTVLPTGQSGNIMSPHYSDQAEMFVKGESRPMLMNHEEIIGSAHNKLLLVPRK